MPSFVISDPVAPVAGGTLALPSLQPESTADGSRKLTRPRICGRGLCVLVPVSMPAPRTWRVALLATRGSPYLVVLRLQGGRAVGSVVHVQGPSPLSTRHVVARSETTCSVTVSFIQMYFSNVKFRKYLLFLNDVLLNLHMIDK